MKVKVLENITDLECGFWFRAEGSLASSTDAAAIQMGVSGSPPHCISPNKKTQAGDTLKE